MSRDRFLNRESEKGHVAYRRSRQQERLLAKRSGGRLITGSGSGPEKGDIKKYSGVFRVEAKTTSHDSFRVTKEMIRKIEDAALPHGELPAIIIEFVDKQGKPISEIAVVSTDVLESLNVEIYKNA